jgi:diguanylate cyclase (GGDEF)-like protein
MSEAVITATAASTIGVMAWAWWHGESQARGILITMSPLAGALGLYAFRDLVFVQMPQAALITLLTGLGASMWATHVVLAANMRARRGSTRRIRQLDAVDPLTGLPSESVFESRLAQLIARAQRFEHESAVVILELTNYPQLRGEFGRKRAVELLLRHAERLGAMVRRVDTIARVGESRFGLLIDGPATPSRARAFCCKLVAQCIAPVAGLPRGMTVKPRVALALVPSHGVRASAVVETLERLLERSARDPSRVILIAGSVIQPKWEEPLHVSIGPPDKLTSSGLGTDFPSTDPMQEI